MLTERMEKPKEQKDGLIGDAALSEKNHRESPLNIVVCINIAFLGFYAIAIFYSFKAYKEFKGIVEDHMGADGLEEMDSQNIIQYGIIKEAPRSD